MRIPSPAVLLFAACLSMVAAACSSGSASQSTANDDTVAAGVDDAAAADFTEATGAVVVNSAGTVTTTGRQRVMTAILGPETRPFLGGPDVDVDVTFEAVEGEGFGEAKGTWLTTNASALGLYVTYFEFPTAGPWQVIVSADGSEVARSQVNVTADSSVPNIGDPAPMTDSPTADTSEEIAAISTDQDPDPRLYELSIADAVGNDRPTMIAFVTPAFCQTALCGPTLEAVKAAAGNHEGIDVVHVEPFDIGLATSGELQPIPAMADWGLQTEPWVFIIDSDGIVSATFEGIIGQAELEAALERL